MTTITAVDRFLDLYGTRTGRWLANRLNLTGPGSIKLADLLSCYAWHWRAADTITGVQQMKGQPTNRNPYRDACLILRAEITTHPLFTDRLALW
jgi:hypothetical protein